MHNASGRIVLIGCEMEGHRVGRIAIFFIDGTTRRHRRPTVEINHVFIQSKTPCDGWTRS